MRSSSSLYEAIHPLLDKKVNNVGDIINNNEE